MNDEPESQIDVKMFIERLDKNAAVLKAQVASVIDYHMMAFADEQGLTSILQHIGTIVQNSTGDPRSIRVTVEFV